VGILSGASVPGSNVFYTIGSGGASIPAIDKAIPFVLERRYWDFINPVGLALVSDQEPTRHDYRKDLRLLQVSDLSFEGNLGGGLHLSNMQNVLSSLADGDHAFVMAVRGTSEGSSLYYGVSRIPGSPSSISTEDSMAVFENALRGNFHSINMKRLSAEDVLESLYKPMSAYREVIALPGIPSPRSNSDAAPFVQGMERVIEAMHDADYLVLVVAEPIGMEEIGHMIDNCLDLSSAVHSMVRATLSTSEGTSQSISLSVAMLAGTISGIPLIGGLGANLGYSYSWSKSVSVSREYLDKTAEYCENLCDRYAQRLRQGKNLGFWNTGLYLFADNRQTLLRGRGALRAALSGGETHWEPIRSLQLNVDIVNETIFKFTSPQFEILRYGIEKKKEKAIVERIAGIEATARSLKRSLTDWIGTIQKSNEAEREILLDKIRKYSPSEQELERARISLEHAQLGHPLGSVMAGLSTPMNTEELAIMVNLPRHEVKGIGVREAATFGINCPVAKEGAEGVTIGNVFHKGRIYRDTTFTISLNDFTRHGFICGVTGSGKTNTCTHILREFEKHRVPFLVIEPAKSEYRSLMSEIPGLLVFTLGDEGISPFRLNPFEFFQGGRLLPHIDGLKAVFNASFPMYASMPYLLEEALYEIYLDKGWDLATSQNRYRRDAEASFHDFLPTLEDLYNKIDTVVRSKQYAQELTMDLSAALKARLGSLLNGSKGLMLNTKRSTPMDELLSSNVVLELKRVGDDDEKCFIMGLLFMKIYEYREATLSTEARLRHVTVIEEAHRLLKNVPESGSAETANVRGKALETFCNVISEVRQYGEGLIVIDQIPAKLTPDVVKNTNFKIVHRTLARDDRDFVGSTMGLTEEQNSELPLLGPGRVVAHREGLQKPFLLQVPKSKGSLSLSDAEVAENMEGCHRQHDYVFWRLPGFEKVPGIARHFGSRGFGRIIPEIDRGIVAAATVFALGAVGARIPLKRKVLEVIESCIGEKDEVGQSCHVIRHADFFFSRINDAYPYHFDHCLKAQRLFVDLWFDCLPEDTDQLLERFQKAMSACTYPNNMIDPMVTWLVTRSNAAKELGASLIRADKDKKLEGLDDFLTSQAQSLVLATDIGYNSCNALKRAILNRILYGNPYAQVIMDGYSRRYLGTGNE
jgi:DNA helicase HerA-like ATPase